MPLADGRLAPYINLDNAATTPPLQEVLDAIYEFLPYYSSVHRGAGFKSRVSTAAYDQAHETIARFVGADLSTNTVIFGKNTTEAINKLAYPLPARPAEHRALDRDGASLERPALARASPGRAGAGHRATDASTKTTSTGCSRIRRSHRPADRERRVERHRLRPANPSSRAQGSRRRRENPRRRRPVGAASSNRRQAGSAIPSISTSWRSRLTRCTPRSAPVRSLADETSSWRVLLSTKAAAPWTVVTPTEVHWAGLPDREEAGQSQRRRGGCDGGCRARVDGLPAWRASNGTKPR